MPLKLVKRDGENWHIYGTVKGKRIRESTGTDNKEAAEKLRIQREHELLFHPNKREEQRTFGDAINSYMRRRDNMGSSTTEYLLRFHRKWGDVLLEDFTTQSLEDWIDERLGEVSSPSVRRELNCIMAVLNHARVRKWIKEVPEVSKPRDGEPRLRALEPEEVASLMSECDRRADLVASMMLLLLNTGARIGEALALEWEEVNMKVADPYIVLQNKKRRGGKNMRRVVPLNAAAQRAIELAAVFSKPDGRVYSQWRTRAAVTLHLKKLASEAGVQNFQVHDTRRTFATRLLGSGAHPRTVADLLGHSSLAMIMRYMVPPDHVRAQAVHSVDTYT